MPDALTQRLLSVARYARHRHRLYDFDEWDLVSWAWVQYHEKMPPTNRYLRMAMWSYAQRERRKRPSAEVVDQVDPGPADGDLRILLGGLTPRQWEVAQGLSRGRPQQAIAAGMGCKHNTVSMKKTRVGDLIRVTGDAA